ncbi:MAG: hypothetical protein IJW24_02605 [Clostridia bacterium]|nr:hypothetical protein [Clostridia bacterium]
MKNSTLLSSVISSAIGAIGIVINIILVSMGTISAKANVYLFIIAFFACAWVPILIELIFKIKIEVLASVIYQIFLILTIIIGSIWKMYDIFAGYDITIHFMSGVLAAIIAYTFVKNSKKFKPYGLWLFVLLFAIAGACGALWEIWEFATDLILDGNSQRVLGFSERTAIMDTMLDIIADVVGGLIGAGICVVCDARTKKAKQP